MRYLKLFENFQSEEEISEICNKYGIENYTINNGLVDVEGNVVLVYEGLSKLPLNFGKISGDFRCSNNLLTSLEGAPNSVGGDFACSFNQLTTLLGAPNLVGGIFSCHSNQLTSLEGAPQSVGGIFNCYYNHITSLKGLSDQHRFGKLDIRDNPFEELYNLLGKWDSVAMYEYFYWDFLFEKDGVWCCDLDNLNSFLMIMREEYGKPYVEVTELKNYKCV